MDAEHRAIAELLALKDAPDDVLLDQVRAIGVSSTHHMLFNEAGRLRHVDLQTAMEYLTLIDRIDALIRAARPVQASDGYCVITGIKPALVAPSRIAASAFGEVTGLSRM